MTLEGAAKDQLLSHDRSLGDDEGTAKGERRRMNAGGAIVVDSGAGIKSQQFRRGEQTSCVPARALNHRLWGRSPSLSESRDIIQITLNVRQQQQ